MIPGWTLRTLRTLCHRPSSVPSGVKLIRSRDFVFVSPFKGYICSRDIVPFLYWQSSEHLCYTEVDFHPKLC